MKVAILTHNAYNNYGGILQAYALKTYIETLGHDVHVIRRVSNRNVFMFVIGEIYHLFKYYKYKRVLSFVYKYVYPGVHKSKVYSQRQIEELEDSFDAWIVGSDQVWRYSFCSQFDYDFFLKFLKSDSVLRIAYSASFGVDTWEFSSKETKIITDLLAQFNLVSTREKSGVELCARYLKCNTISLPDPTMLFDANFYSSLIDNTEEILIPSNGVFSYFIGDLPFLDNLIEDLQKELNIDYNTRCRLYISEPVISVEQWLYNIKTSKFVVTDSFHGCVFSILFRKQFIVCDNVRGGSTRVNSLLSDLNISSSRIVNSLDHSNISDIVSKEIDYDSVFILLDKNRKLAKSFLSF
ncbi:MAG: polysaccharide pyruvyl transferase family protein [Bacteroidales bacterium]